MYYGSIDIIATKYSHQPDPAAKSIGFPGFLHMVHSLIWNPLHSLLIKVRHIRRAQGLSDDAESVNAAATEIFLGYGMEPEQGVLTEVWPLHKIFAYL